VAGARSQELQAFLLWAVLVLKGTLLLAEKILFAELNELTKGHNSKFSYKRKTITAGGRDDSKAYKLYGWTGTSHCFT